jgi:hypothetical protein
MSATCTSCGRFAFSTIVCVFIDGWQQQHSLINSRVDRQRASPWPVAHIVRTIYCFVPYPVANAPSYSRLVVAHPLPLSKAHLVQCPCRDTPVHLTLKPLRLSYDSRIQRPLWAGIDCHRVTCPILRQSFGMAFPSSTFRLTPLGNLPKPSPKLRDGIGQKNFWRVGCADRVWRPRKRYEFRQKLLISVPSSGIENKRGKAIMRFALWMREAYFFVCDLYRGRWLLETQRIG